MTLAYGVEKSQSDLGETIAVNHFLDALNDDELALKVREREPADLDAAVKHAVRFESFIETATKKRGKHVNSTTFETAQGAGPDPESEDTRQPKPHRSRRARKQNNASPLADASLNASINVQRGQGQKPPNQNLTQNSVGQNADIIRQLQIQIEACNRELEALKNKSGRGNSNNSRTDQPNKSTQAREFRGRQGRGGNTSGRTITCFSCGNTGHYSFNCPFATQQPGVGQSHCGTQP